MRQLQQDPNKHPVGRQPLNYILAPSKAGTYSWYGDIIGPVEGRLAFDGGERFTREQQAALIKLGRDIPTAPAMTVKRQATYQEIWRGPYDLPEVFAFECPLLGETRIDGKVRVITPNGSKAWVFPDGWSHRPYRLPAVYSQSEQR